MALYKGDGSEMEKKRGGQRRQEGEQKEEW